MAGEDQMAGVFAGADHRQTQQGVMLQVEALAQVCIGPTVQGRALLGDAHPVQVRERQLELLADHLQRVLEAGHEVGP
ncbi:hypothetical protein D3C81_1949260 [compost metagenome]